MLKFLVQKLQTSQNWQRVDWVYEALILAHRKEYDRIARKVYLGMMRNSFIISKLLVNFIDYSCKLAEEKQSDFCLILSISG